MSYAGIGPQGAAGGGAQLGPPAATTNTHHTTAITGSNSPPPPALLPPFSDGGRPRFISLFNTLLGILLACLGVAWAIKSYNYTQKTSDAANAMASEANELASTANAMAIDANVLASTANGYAEGGMELALLSSLVQLCLDDNVSILSIDDEVCQQYISAMDDTLTSVLPSLSGFQALVTSPLPTTTTTTDDDDDGDPSTTRTRTRTTLHSTTLTSDDSTFVTTRRSTSVTRSATSYSQPTGSADSGAGGGGGGSDSSGGDGGGELPLGAILGIITGIFAVATAALIYFIWYAPCGCAKRQARRRHRRQQQELPQEQKLETIS